VAAGRPEPARRAAGIWIWHGRIRLTWDGEGGKRSLWWPQKYPTECCGFLGGSIARRFLRVFWSLFLTFKSLVPSAPGVGK
jgi:hypothetical protein